MKHSLVLAALAALFCFRLDAAVPAARVNRPVMTIGTFCGFEFGTRLNVREMSAPEKDANGLYGPATTKLKKPFRTFEEAVLWYSEEKLSGVELTCVMPKGTTVEKATEELTEVRTVLSQKYRIRFMPSMAGLSVSSRHAPGNYRNTFFTSFSDQPNYVIAICGDEIKIPKRATLQTGKDLATDDFIVLTVRVSSKKVGRQAERQQQSQPLDGLDAL